MLDAFAKVKVMVVGDVMLDRYWWGTVKRISPEAPVPVVDLQRSSFSPGGAANVAANVRGLGAEIFLVGSIGKDHEAETLVGVLKEMGISPDYLLQSARPTSVKTRIIAHNQQVVRVDHEAREAFTPDDQAKVSEMVSSLLPQVDVIVVSDYAKGLLAEGLIAKLIRETRTVNKQVLIDPKGKDYSRYMGATLLTPNRREAAEACNLSEDLPDLINIAGRRLLDELSLEMVLITQSEEGMTLFQNGVEPIHLGTTAKEIYDVTGAGDTVVASLGVALGAGMDIVSACTVANLSAGLVVEQVGTTAISHQMLRGVLSKV